jgi:hypothetical protein
MLNQRQLVLAAAGIDDQMLGQLAGDLAIVQHRRLADRAQERRPFHLRQEILGLIDRLREPLEAGADAQELRAHGQDGIEALRWVLLQTDQKVDEQLRLVAAGLPGEAEQLLELIDQDADVVVPAAAEQLRERSWRLATMVQPAVNLVDAVRVGTGAVQFGERRDQVTYRRFARPHVAGAPPDTAAGAPLLELDQPHPESP